MEYIVGGTVCPLGDHLFKPRPGGGVEHGGGEGHGGNEEENRRVAEDLDPQGPRFLFGPAERIRQKLFHPPLKGGGERGRFLDGKTHHLGRVGKQEGLAQEFILSALVP
ncbi:MAG: hypothetical protein EOM52_02360 [Clostridia bacterium]|nr:hypothetical protein [Clostridia bacterium]